MHNTDGLKQPISSSKPYQALRATCLCALSTKSDWHLIDEYDLMSVAYHASFGSNTFCTPCVPDWKIRQKALMALVGKQWSPLLRKLTPPDGKPGELVRFEVVPGVQAAARNQQQAMEFDPVYEFFFATRFGIAGILAYNLIRETSEQMLWEQISPVLYMPHYALLYAAIKIDMLMRECGGNKEKAFYQWLRFNVDGTSGDKATRIRVVAESWRAMYRSR